jgi:hypothetical protein
MLIALWIRSYHVNEAVAFSVAGTKFHIQSVSGRIVFGTASNSVSFRQNVSDNLRKAIRKSENWLGFSFYRAPRGDRLNDLCYLRVPDWFLVTLFGVLTALPGTKRFSRRYSLRTLLIAITTIAIALGLILAVARH